jgi:hypothetical protein
MKNHEILEINDTDESGYEILYYANTWILFAISLYGGYPQFVETYHRYGSRNIDELIEEMFMKEDFQSLE